MRRRDVLSSPRLREIEKKRTKVLRNNFFLFVFVFGFLFAMFTMASRADTVNIHKVQIIGSRTISPGVIEEKVWEELQGNYFGVFPKTNFFLYPKLKLRERIEGDLKIVKDINIALGEAGVLEVSFAEREPAHTWCGESMPLDPAQLEGEKCYFIDDSGFIFDEAPYFSGNVYFRFFGKVTEDGETPVGKYYFPEIWQRLNVFRNSLSEIGLDPLSVFIKEDGDIEINLRSRTLTSDSQKVIIKKDSDFEAMLDNLASALSTEPLKTDIKEKYDNLLYLDLRFGNKVFFKFK